jgi:hypothetical protein
MGITWYGCIMNVQYSGWLVTIVCLAQCKPALKCVFPTAFNVLPHLSLKLRHRNSEEIHDNFSLSRQNTIFAFYWYI